MLCKEVDMKRLVAVITLFIICTGCNFSTTTGSIIPKYGNPKTALLVLDMQEDFGENAKLPINKEQVPAITAVVNSLIDDFERNGQLIIYVKSEFPKHAIGNRIRNYAAIEGSPGTNIFGKIT